MPWQVPADAVMGMHYHKKPSVCIDLVMQILSHVCGAAEAIREQGVANVVFYSKPAQALHACQFAHAFFATLRSMTAPLPEV